jgi:hypothetical protein
MNCLACSQEMNYLKEYQLDSRDNNRGILGAIFDVEEHLIFDIYVCPGCRRTEFIYKGDRKDLDWD